MAPASPSQVGAKREEDHDWQVGNRVIMRKLLVLGGAALIVLLATASNAAAHGSSSTFTCTGTITGQTLDDVEVPANEACTLVDSTVNGDVSVRENAYLQATNTDVSESVTGYDALTIFIDTGSTVGGRVRGYSTFQVFVYNSTVGGDIKVSDTDDRINICGTTLEHGNIWVFDSGTDILIGDPLTEGCPGNTLQEGDIRVEDNFTDVEFVIRANTVADDLRVFDNEGPVEKFVQDNTGGDELECSGNEDPFTASGNTGFASSEGQCAVVSAASDAL
jgi:hypothetical protein